MLALALMVLVSGCITAANAEPAVCKDCKTGAMAPMVDGTATIEDGTQVLAVGVATGYYSPNRFTVDAGKPVRVVFEGAATGCLSKPQFPALGKKADMASGPATIELGTLAPGTYTFTCGMKMNSGTITVK